MRQTLQSLLLAAALAIHALTPASAAQDGHAWSTYANPRFGVSICYPADLVAAQSAPDNVDGITLAGRDGAKIAVWGSFNALESTLAASAREDEQRLAGTSGRVSYRLIRPRFYVLSGERDGQVFYHRTALSGETFSTVELTYPVAGKEAWDAISARVSRCFKPGRGQ